MVLISDQLGGAERVEQMPLPWHRSLHMVIAPRAREASPGRRELSKVSTRSRGCHDKPAVASLVVLQLAPTDCPLLGHAVAALGQDVELALLRQQFDLNSWPRLLPRLGDQMLLQTRQAPLRRAHQVMHRRLGRAHFCEYL